MLDRQEGQHGHTLPEGGSTGYRATWTVEGCAAQQLESEHGEGFGTHDALVTPPQRPRSSIAAGDQFENAPHSYLEANKWRTG
jgi:hypothetical protein